MSSDWWMDTINGPAGPLPRAGSRRHLNWVPRVGEIIFCHLTKEEADDIWCLIGKRTHRIPAVVTEVVGDLHNVDCECLWERKLKYVRNKCWIAPMSPLEALAFEGVDVDDQE